MSQQKVTFVDKEQFGTYDPDPRVVNANDINELKAVINTISDAVFGGNVTANPPTVSADDAGDTLSASSPYGASEIVFSTNGGAYVPYTGQIAVGNVDRTAGYWRFKVKAAAGRNESIAVDSPAFTAAATTPVTPTVHADDDADTISASHPLGVSELLVSTNNGAFGPYTGPINVGDSDRPAGYFRYKTRAVAGRNESAVALSPAFTQRVTPVAPTVNGNDTADTLSASHQLGASEILVSENNGPFVAYTGTIAVGNVARPQGYWKFKVRAASGRNESPVAESPAFAVTSNVTPDAPTVSADDDANILQFIHPLGAGEIVISINNGPYAAYPGVINIGNVNLPVGYYKAKVRAAAGRNESAVVSSPAFTATALPTPDAPTAGTVNDALDTFDFTLNPLYPSLSDYEYTVNGGNSRIPVTAKPIAVGNANYAIGKVGVRVKGTVERNPSPWLFNEVAFSFAGAYNTTMLNYFTAIGLTDDATVLYAGTEQEITVGTLKQLYNDVFNVIDTMSGVAAVYPTLGETLAQQSVNAVSPGTHDMIASGTIVATPFGPKGDGTGSYLDTGIVPQDLYGYTPEDWLPEPQDYFWAAYTSSAKFSAEARNSWQFQASNWMNKMGTLFHVDFPGDNESADGGRMITFAAPGGGGYMEAEAGGGTASMKLNGTVLGSKSQAVGNNKGYNGQTSIKTSLYETPWSFLLIGKKSGTTEAQRDALREAVIAAETYSNRHIGPPTEAAPPSALLVDDVAKQIQFTYGAGSEELSHYELSTDGGETYTTLSNTNARKIMYSNTFSGFFKVFLGNVNVPVGQLKVRVKQRPGLIASAAISSGAPLTVTPGYDRWRPFNMVYNDELVGGYGDVVNYKSVSWSHAFTEYTPGRTDGDIDQVDFRDYEVTFNASAQNPTWEPCPSIPLWVGDRNVAVGDFGVRRINYHGDGLPMSGALVNTVAFTAGTPEVVNQALKAKNTTCKATTTEGSTQVVLSNNVYGLVGDGTEYIVIDNDTAPGLGNRGTRGVGGEWPKVRFANAAAARAAFDDPQYEGSGWWAWIEGDGRARRKRDTADDSSDQWETTGWGVASGDPSREYAYALTHRSRVMAPPVDNGNGTFTVTLEYAPKLSVAGATVYFDNAPIIQNTLQSGGHFKSWTLAPGVYKIANQVAVDAKFGMDLKFRGVTLEGVDNQICSVYFTSCNGLKINNQAGTDKFIIAGTVNYDHAGLPVVREGSSYNESNWPDDYHPGGNITVFWPGLGNSSRNARMWDVEVRDCLFLNIYMRGADSGLYRPKSVRNNVYVWTGHNVAYYAWYYWSVQFDGAGGGFIDGTALDGTSPTVLFQADKWVNGLESYIAAGLKIKNVILNNACAAMNSSIDNDWENVTFNLTALRAFQDTVSYPIFDYNNRIRGWLNDLRYNRFKNIKFNIPQTLSEVGLDLYPAGFQNNNDKVPCYIDGLEYHHPNMVQWNPWRSCAYTGSGTTNNIVKNVVATGNWGTVHLNNEAPNQYKASIAISDSDGVHFTTLENVTVPTAYIGNGHVLVNVTATEVPIVRPSLVNAGADATVNNGSYTFNPSITPANGTSVSVTEWIFKGAVSYGAPVPYNGNSGTSIAIPATFPAVIDNITDLPGLVRPIGANIYLYNPTSDKQIEAKVLAYNSETGYLKINATAATTGGVPGATGTYSDWDTYSEPLISDIYDEQATVTLPAPAVYNYQLKVTASNGSVTRDDIVITSE